MSSKGLQSLRRKATRGNENRRCTVFTLAVNNGKSGNNDMLPTDVTLSLESLTRHFLASNGITWPLALKRNLEERGGLLFTTFRKLVCFENRKMA